MDEKNAEQTGEAQDQVDNSKRNIVAALLGSLGVAALSSCTNQTGEAIVGEPTGKLREAISGNDVGWISSIGLAPDLRLNLRGTAPGIGIFNEVMIAENFYEPAPPNDPDGGGGVFYWSEDTATPDNGGTVIVPFSNAGENLTATQAEQTGCWKRIYSGALNVKWFGAKGNGTDPDTTAIQAAIALSETTKAKVSFPQGCFLHSGLVVRSNGVCLEGTGDYGTVLMFQPPNGTAVGISFSVDTPSALNPLEACGVANLAMCGDGSEQSTNAMVEIVDTRKFSWRAVRVGQVSQTTPQLAWSGIGLRIRGRDSATFEQLLISCDCPIEFKANPVTAAGVCDADHFCFRDCYLASWKRTSWGNTRYLVEIDPGLVINRLAFEGYQAWVAGAGGLRWYDTISTEMSVGWRITNVRYEKDVLIGSGIGGWIFYIYKTGGQPLSGATFDSIDGGETGNPYNGFLFRNCFGPQLSGVVFRGGSSSTWLDVNHTVKGLRTRGCVAQDGAALSLGDSTDNSAVIEDSSRALGPGVNSTIDPADTTYNDKQWTEHYGMRRWSWVGDLADEGQVVIPIGASRKVAWIDLACSPGATAYGTSGLSAIEDCSGAYLLSSVGNSGITDTDGKICLIHTGGTNNPIVKNRMGSTQSVMIDVRWKA